MFIKDHALFTGIPASRLEKLLSGKCGEVIFGIGENIIQHGTAPSSVYLITEGSARVLQGPPEQPTSLELLNKGSMLGWFSLARGNPCEWVRAASEVKAMAIPAKTFTILLA